MQSKRLVLDANIIIRAVLGRKVRELLEQHWGKTLFFTPDVCLQDAHKYLPALFEKRNLPVEPALDMLNALEKIIEPVDKALYAPYMEKAQERIRKRDIEDWPIVATALALDCPVWTEDMDFFGAGIPTWTTDRVHIFLTGLD